MASQVKAHVMSILQSALYCCIIADEWTCQHSNKGYISVSLRFVTESLKAGTCFLGDIKIFSTKSKHVKDAIIKAMTR